MNLMKQFADPDLMYNLSMSEKLMGAAVTTLMGMGVTFFVLLFLWGSISLISKIQGSKSSQKCDVCIQEQPLPLPVIAAAIAAYNDEKSGFVVRKIKRLPEKNAWAQTVRERRINR